MRELIVSSNEVAGHRPGRRNVGGHLAVALFLMITAVFADLRAGAAQEQPVVREFDARITAYLELRKNEAGAPRKSAKSPQKVDSDEQQMAAKVRSARADAKQGSIFTPEICDYFRQQIAVSLTGPRGARIRASLRHAEPVPDTPLQVNQAYPKGLPLQSTPPSLLLNLPRLPKELEYRIVGHDLVLHDIGTNLIVDLVPNAIPTS